MSKRLLTIMAVGLAVVGAACSSSDGETATTPSGSTATTAVTATTTKVPAFGAADALSVTEAYFEAFNSGDGAAALALLTADARLSDSFIGLWTAQDWEMLTIWNTAQGTILASPSCAVVDEVEGESATISCQSANSDALVQAVGAIPVPANVTTLVSPEGISSFRFDYGDPFFDDVGNPFDTWMAANHPEDVEAVGFGNWTSVEEAQQNGELTAEYAAEWAAYVDANDCDYRLTC